MFTIEARGGRRMRGLNRKRRQRYSGARAQTDRLHSLNGGPGGISVNVGVFQGGTLSNVVAAQARAEIDVRFSTADEAALLKSEILNLRPFDDRVELIVKGGINRPPLERNEKVARLFDHARALASQLHFELDETQVGGASDGNFAAAVGAAVLDGLGIDGDGAHATHEHILLDDIPRRGALLAGLIATL